MLLTVSARRRPKLYIFYPGDQQICRLQTAVACMSAHWGPDASRPNPPTTTSPHLLHISGRPFPQYEPRKTTMSTSSVVHVGLGERLEAWINAASGLQHLLYRTRPCWRKSDIVVDQARCRPFRPATASPANMSVTTTANPVSSAVLQALTDYDIHHSGDPENPRTPEAPNAQPLSATSAQNPPDWDTEHRRVPPHRPTQDQRGPERPDGVNAIERGFIATMFLGVRTLAVSVATWSPF
jgi:hypothetical protein